MFITTKAQFIWNEESGQYVEIYTEGYEYEGELSFADIEDDREADNVYTGQTADTSTYGLDIGDWSSESDLFSKITGGMREATERDTYQPFFEIQQQGAQSNYLSSLGGVGYTKGGQASGFAGSDSTMMSQLEGEYAGKVFATETDIQGKMADAQASVQRTIVGNQQVALTLKGMEQGDKPKKKKCCFILLEAENGNVLDINVRKYRDLMMNDINRKGYYKLASVLVPFMRKSKIIKALVNYSFTYPAKSWSKWYYERKGMGWVFEPLRKFWLNMFNYLGQTHKFKEEEDG